MEGNRLHNWKKSVRVHNGEVSHNHLLMRKCDGEGQGRCHAVIWKLLFVHLAAYQVVPASLLSLLPSLAPLLLPPMRTPSIYSQDDPITAAMKPPPDETDSERIARQHAEAEAKRVSELIDDNIREEKERTKKRKGDVKVRRFDLDICT